MSPKRSVSPFDHSRNTFQKVEEEMHRLMVERLEGVSWRNQLFLHRAPDARKSEEVKHEEGRDTKTKMKEVKHSGTDI